VLRAVIDVWHAFTRVTQTTELIPCSHDAYLKAFQLDRSKRFEAFKGFELLLLDEAQDCTACQLAIVHEAPLPAAIAYDPHQAIYQFRLAHACDTLDRNVWLRFYKSLEDFIN